jgi:hypothetical protein
VDVSLLGRFGVQVKNLSVIEDYPNKSSVIPTSTSIDRISKYLPDGGQDLRIFLANFYFNQSFANSAYAQWAFEGFKNNL